MKKFLHLHCIIYGFLFSCRLNCIKQRFKGSGRQRQKSRLWPLIMQLCWRRKRYLPTKLSFSLVRSSTCFLTWAVHEDAAYFVVILISNKRGHFSTCFASEMVFKSFLILSVEDFVPAYFFLLKNNLNLLLYFHSFICAYVNSHMEFWPD